MSAVIADNLKDLLQRPIVVAFATSNPDGQPQVTPVWASLEGDQVWINSAVGRRKDLNVRANPKVTVLSLDPQDPFHWVEFEERSSNLMRAMPLWHTSTSCPDCTPATMTTILLIPAAGVMNSA